MLRALRTRRFARCRQGLLVALIALAGTAVARAQGAAEELGHGRSALPAVDLVPVLAAERAHVIRAHGSIGYGYTESVLDAGDSHHRTEAQLALSYQWIDAVAFAGRFDARFDTHTGEGSDDGGATQAWWIARAATDVSPNMRAGVEAALRFPGTSDVGRTLQAVSPEARAALTLAPPAWHASLTGALGFRLDRAQGGVEEPEQLSLPDRVALGASDANAVLFGLAAARSFGRIVALAEWSWDLQVGDRAAAALESPMRVVLGARLLLSNSLQAQLLATVSPSARPAITVDGPLYPIEPRLQIALGLGMRFGDSPSERSPAPPPVLAVKPEPPPAPPPPTTRSMSGRVVDGASRAPVAGAEIASAQGAAATTDAGGLFHLEGMPLGFVELRVRAAGFKEAVVPVGQGVEQAADLEIELEPATMTSLIRGTVSNFQGRVVAGHVLVQPGNVGAVLDANGNFEIEVQPGEYTVLIKASGYGLQQRHVHVERGDVAVIVVQLQAER